MSPYAIDQVTALEARIDRRVSAALPPPP